MKLIQIEKINDSKFLVTVTKSKVTLHTVHISDVAHRQYSFGRMTKEQLIKKSFLFLLQREDQTSILSEFNIEVIGDYFPEYLNIGKLGWIDVSG